MGASRKLAKKTKKYNVEALLMKVKHSKALARSKKSPDKCIVHWRSQKKIWEKEKERKGEKKRE